MTIAIGTFTSAFFFSFFIIIPFSPPHVAQQHYANSKLIGVPKQPSA
jgi:hypothetical protein